MKAIAITIASGQSLSAVADLRGLELIDVGLSSSWTTANLTVQVSDDSLTFSDVYDPYGNELVWIAAASRAIFADPAAPSLGNRYIRLRSGTSGTPVNQGAARTLVLHAREVGGLR